MWSMGFMYHLKKLNYIHDVHCFLLKADLVGVLEYMVLKKQP